MINKPEIINTIIAERRSVFPKYFIEKEIDEAIIWQLLKNANLAPTHKLTQPWRFIVFRKESRKGLSNFLAEWYKNNTPPELFLQKKYDKTLAKPLQSDCVIAICMNRSSLALIPEWEEVAAVACAVQNMWLTCTAYGIGSYWSSPKSIYDANEFLGLKDEEKCLGFFYMGYFKGEIQAVRRNDIKEKTKWL